MATLTEAHVEAVLLDHLASLDYACLNDAVSGPNGAAPERHAYSDTIPTARLRAAIARLNPQIPDEAREDALRRVLAVDRPSLIEENRRLHPFLVDGVPVEYRAADGTIRGDAARLMDPDDALNDWLAMDNPTIVVITDRNDLDDQLFATFSTCQDLIRQTPAQADSREDLQQILARAAGGVVFTTIQKFAPAKAEVYPPLTDRRNVTVIADEAHRSQYGFKARIEKTGEIAYPCRRSGVATAA